MIIKYNKNVHFYKSTDYKYIKKYGNIQSNNLILILTNKTKYLTYIILNTLYE
jgi:hypothetical protein